MTRYPSGMGGGLDNDEIVDAAGVTGGTSDSSDAYGLTGVAAPGRLRAAEMVVPIAYRIARLLS